MSHKILFISECTGITGGARQFLALAQGLARKDWDVRIACPEGAETYRTAQGMGLPVFDFSPRQDYDVPAAYRLARRVAQDGIELVHAHHSRAHAVGLLAAYLARWFPTAGDPPETDDARGARVRLPRFVVTRRVSFSPKRNPLSLYKYRSRRIDSFVAVAESIRRILIQAGVAPERVVTIPSGVDLERFSPRPKDAGLVRELALPAGVPVVGLIAHFGAWKGHGVFLATAGLLKSRGVRAVYLLAGRETDGGAARELVRANGLTEQDVRLLGFREDMPRVLSLLDLNVSASTSGEGLSGALRESLAMGIPAIASDVGGNRELIADRQTGRLFPPGDAQALADRVVEMISGPEEARRTAQAGREFVRRNLGVERMVESTAELYQSLLP